MIKQIALAAAIVLATASTAAVAGKHGDKKAADMKSTEVRDWKKVDTNGDNLVSPDEMEKFLTSVWQAKKTASK